MARTSPISPHVFAAALLVTALGACTDAPTALDHEAPLASEAHFARVNDRNGFEAFQVAFDDGFICQGDPNVWTELTGQLKLASASPRPGGGVRIVEILSNGRISLSGNGKTLSSAMAGTLVIDVNAAGEVERMTFPGSNGVFTAPGWGRILAETGHLALDGQGNLIRETGWHDVFGSNPNAAKLCAFLND